MTCSFHRYDGLFFPGTGALTEVGSEDGKYFSINVPLHEAVNDGEYTYIFKNVMREVMSSFRPSVIVLQCGADSLAGDRLGSFNLSIKGHGECVNFMKTFQTPMIVLGGGGYTIRNVARCWTYETSVLCGVEICNELPYNEYLSHYGPDYLLHSETPDVRTSNSKSYLDRIIRETHGYLRYLEGCPSVQMQECPRSVFRMRSNSDSDSSDSDTSSI